MGTSKPKSDSKVKSTSTAVKSLKPKNDKKDDAAKVKGGAPTRF